MHSGNKEEKVPVKYYEASIILEDGSVKGGYTGDTPGEADRAARDVINTGELFPSPVKVRVAKCEFISEQPAFMREKGKLLQYDPKFGV